MPDEMLNLPVIPLRGLTILPGTTVHFDVSRKQSIAAANEAVTTGEKLFVVTQKDPVVDAPGFDDVYKVGTVVEVKQAESDKDARIVSRKMAEDLENRASFRRVQKMAIQKALKAGAKGIKTMVSGRLGGAEIARSEWYSEGSVPLHTFRANIDYATAEAATTYGKLGVKVWINKGEVLPEAKKTVPSKEDK